MPTDIVQVATSTGSTVASPTTTQFALGNKAGNLIVLGISIHGVGTISSVTDTQGNVYTQAGTFTGYNQVLIYYAISNGALGANTVTVAWASASRVTIFAAEYRGPWPSVIVDVTAGINGNPPPAYNVTTTKAADLIVTFNDSAGGGGTWSALSGTDRSGLLGQIEFNDILQAALGATSIFGTFQFSTFTSISVAFFTITEPSLVATYAIDDLLSIVNDELHGKKNAFPETQKIRHLNKGLDEMWKIMKLLKGGYWQTNNAPGLILDTINTDFILPADFSEVRLIEVTNPVDYVGIDVVQMPMTTALFKTERQSFRAFQTVATADSVLAIPGQLNYDIYGPDNSNKMHMLFSRPAPVPLTLLIWYIRMVGHFSVPKNPSEILQSLMSPYVWNLAVYAAKSLLKSESNDAQEFAKWEEQWSKEIDRAMPAAHERASADEQTCEGFAEM